MPANLPDGQMVGLRIDAEEECNVRIAFYSKCVTQLGNKSGSFDNTYGSR